MFHDNVKKVLKTLKFDIDSYRKYRDACRIYIFLMKIFGSAVLTYQFDSNDRPITKFTALGAFGFLFWHIIYFYYAYIVYLEDQTILRFLYNTKLEHYGDDLSRIVSLLFVAYMMWKIPFNLSGNTLPVQHLLEIDQEIEKLGVKANFSEYAYFSLLTVLGQIVVVFIRFLSLWLVQKHMPRAIVVQLGFSDSVALIYTTHLAFSLIYLRERHRKLNKTLNEVKNRNDLIFVVSRQSNKIKSKGSKDNLVCFKIRTCAVVYSKLYKASDDLTSLYGFATTLTMFFNLLYVILNLFYLMEATASGLFHDTERYINFVIYVFWQISYAFGITFLIVYFCVSVVEEAKRTSFIAHKIINANWSPEITEEAMKLSMQLLHQKPEFSAFRLVKIDYALLLQGGHTVVTILVTLLQFVTD